MVSKFEATIRRYWLFDLGFIIYFIYYLGPLTDLVNASLVRLSNMPFALGMIILATTILFFRDNVFRLITPGGRAILILLIIMTLAIFVKTLFFDQNEIDFVYVDFEAAALFLTGIMLGMNHFNWEHLLKVYKNVLLVGIFTNLIALAFLEGLSRDLTEGSIVNKMQVLLYPATFTIFLFPFTKNRKDKAIYLTAFLLFFIEQLIFQKRLPTIRLMVTVVFISIIVSQYRRTQFFTYILNFLRYNSAISFAILLVIALSVVVGFNLSQSVSGLLDRYTVSGSVARTAMEDGRYQLALDVFLNIMSKGYFLFGQGFGGALSGGMIYWTIETSSSFQKFSTHVIEFGQIWPLWKGGIFYWLLITVIFIGGIFRLPSARTNYLALSCWAFTLITWLFLFGEEFWHSPMLILLIGAALGYLYNKDISRYLNPPKQFVVRKSFSPYIGLKKR